MDCWESYYRSGSVNSGASHYHFGSPDPSTAYHSFGHAEASGNSSGVYTSLSDVAECLESFCQEAEVEKVVSMLSTSFTIMM